MGSLKNAGPETKTEVFKRKWATIGRFEWVINTKMTFSNIVLYSIQLYDFKLVKVLRGNMRRISKKNIPMVNKAADIQFI
jgi:hypothetical protein